MGGAVVHPGDDATNEVEALRRELERLRAAASTNRSLLTAMLDYSPHGIMVSDAGGRLVLQNRAAERIWAGSATADSVAGWGQYRGFHPDGRPFAPEDWAMATCLRERVVVEARELRIQRFDDSFATLLASSAPIFDEAGALEGAIAVFADITQLKQAEAALQETEHRHAQILDTLPAMVYCKTVDSRVVFANRAARRFYTVGEIDPRRRDNREVFELGRTVEATAEPYVDASGEVRYFDVVKSPLFDATGKVVQVIGVARDVTATRRGERRLAAHHALAAELAKATTPAEAMPRVLAALATTLEWDTAAWWRLDDDVMVCAAYWEAGPTGAFAAETRAMRAARGVGVPGRVWQDGQPFWRADLSTGEPIARARAAAESGLRAAFAFPILVGQRVVGAVDFFSRAVQPPDDELIHTLRALGNQLGEWIERARVQQAVADSEAAKAAILEAALDCIVTIGEDGRVLEWNPAAERVLGYRRDQAIGREMAELIVPERHRAAHRSGLARVLAGGTPALLGKRLELSARHQDGHELPIELAITAVDAGGRRFFTGYLRDISDRQRAWHEREELIRSLEQSNADLDAFAHVTSHDLKAPLRGIASLAAWLEEDMAGKLSDQGRHYLQLLRGRVDRLSGLIEGVLAYSRAGRSAGRRETIDVAELLRDSIALLAPPPHVSIVVQPPMPVLETARTPIQQVLLNLLGNAIKHGTRPGQPGVVLVRAAAHGDFWELTVADDGPGIAPEFHERIWGVFQTLAPRDRVESTGIGLSVVRKIVEQRGGRAWVESAVGQGAVFHFTWPRIDRKSGP